ncbi:uncharacterized protein BO96DRAFT_136170 [Aspergillus niger CBS 101883]|uniref:uncharacterized protein n=1 Tax=Aspergillus lacticoffeatus (strain CBS 101883) TaxID=1450533 RepID=UPI000D7F8368|nr:uncharacterized protein BO96DRAFT_136170 [Aspergillus niger CBS 101883]PYH52908.1 hypothetical protein BO96DRAFT_136170 [Aspergillus niger CBS 101883]
MYVIRCLGLVLIVAFFSSAKCDKLFPSSADDFQIFRVPPLGLACSGSNTSQTRFDTRLRVPPVGEKWRETQSLAVRTRQAKQCWGGLSDLAVTCGFVPSPIISPSYISCIHFDSPCCSCCLLRLLLLLLPLHCIRLARLSA